MRSAKDRDNHSDVQVNMTGIGNAKADKQAGAPADVGAALRAVYREAVDEAVPDEMLDLLRKLG